uniref:E3 ubiquitin-protein ligase APD1-4 N-terminal domain-containing protein n=1 Tax=Scylla olivacea TaxID=85551 RepID=A0A0P4W959_SCYOL
MVVRFSQGHGGAEGKEGMYLSPLVMEEGGGGGGRGRDAVPKSASKMSFLEYYQQMNLDRYLQAERRQASGGCMASAWRVISFFLVVFVLPTVLISLPLYARYHLYHTRHLPMTETDTRALNYAVSPFWCQGQRVSSNGTLDAYLVSGTPKVRKEKRHVSLKRKLLLQHDDIEYWGVYLLEGSTFTVSSTARWPGGVLLVAKGEENLRKCFYREDHLEAELNGAPPKTVYRSPVDVDDLPAEVLVEEEHHWADNGGEVFDEEGEDVLVDNLGIKPLKDKEDEEVEVDIKEEEEEEEKTRTTKHSTCAAPVIKHPTCMSFAR